MSQYVSTHALERSISTLATGGVLALDARRAAAGYDQLQQLALQFQVPISGTASSGIAWTTVQLPFDVAFLFAPEQRDSPLAVPHFTSGVVVAGAGASTASAEAALRQAQAILAAAVASGASESEIIAAELAVTVATTNLNTLRSGDPNNPACLVGVFVQVIGWGRDLSADAIIGAEVGIGASTIGGRDVDFDGYVHLQFEGYGAVSDTPPTVPDQQLRDLGNSLRPRALSDPAPVTLTPGTVSAQTTEQQGVVRR